MKLPHRLIIDGVEQCASDDAGEFLRLAHWYLGNMGQEIAESGITPQWVNDVIERHRGYPKGDEE